MTDELVNKGRLDRGHISMSSRAERRFWSRHLGLTEGDLQQVVDKVGNSIAAVRKELGRAKENLIPDSAQLIAPNVIERLKGSSSAA